MGLHSPEAAGKLVREEGKLDLGSSSEDNFHDSLGVPPAATAELVGNAHSSRWDGSQIHFSYRSSEKSKSKVCLVPGRQVRV